MLGDISVLDKVYIVCGRTDMRKQIDVLCAIIEEQLKMNTNDNRFFLFCGRKKDRIIMYPIRWTRRDEGIA